MNIIEAKQVIDSHRELIEEARLIKSMKEDLDESLKLVKGETKADIVEGKEFIASQMIRYEEIKTILDKVRTDIRIGLAKDLVKAEAISEIVAELEIASDAYNKEGNISLDAQMESGDKIDDGIIGHSDVSGQTERVAQIETRRGVRRTYEQMVSFYTTIKERLAANGITNFPSIEIFLTMGQSIVPDLPNSAKDMGKSERNAIREVLGSAKIMTQRPEQKFHAQAANEERKKYSWNK